MIKTKANSVWNLLKDFQIFSQSTYDPQLVQIKGSTISFQNGDSYDLNDPDLKYLITNTQFDKQFDNLNLIYSFLHDMKYNIKKR